MSVRFGSLGLFFSVVAIALAANQADLEHAKATRGPASVARLHKEEILGPFHEASEIRHTEKLRGPVSVKIELLGETPKAGETFVLRGTIASRRSLNSTNYTWNIPAGIEVVNGAVNGQLQNVSSDQPAVVELTLKKLTDDNAQVHFMANSALGEARVGDSAQFNTDVQSLLNGSKGSLLGKAASGASLKANKTSSELKIFH